MFTFTDNENLKKELKLFQVANDLDNITEICKKMGIIPQAYYDTTSYASYTSAKILEVLVKEYFDYNF